MLVWRREDNRRTLLSRIERVIEMTIFAISKSSETMRLICWPRIPNNSALDPPKPDFLHPRLFGHITTCERQLNGAYLDAENMLHNLRIPPHVRDLFALPEISYHLLPT